MLPSAWLALSRTNSEASGLRVRTLPTVTVTVAVVGAIGVIVVALIGVMSSRFEANNKRARLLKDLEILGKLDTASPESGALKASIASDVASMVRADKIRGGVLSLRTNLGWAFVFMVGSALLATALDKYNVGPQHGGMEAVATALQWASYAFLALAGLSVFTEMIPAVVSVVRSDWRRATDR